MRASFSSSRLLVAAQLLSLVALGCHSEEAAPSAPSLAGWNVLFITLDTTRADRLGSYGHAMAETPHLDALAEAGARFARAYAHVPLTLPTHASLFTGTFPPEHGIHDNGRRALGGELATLAETFKTHGYRTGAFVSAIALDGSFGLDRGFDEYDDALGEPAPGLVRVLDRRGSEVVDQALRWLNATEGPFFLWTHFYDPHAEYRPPADFQKDDAYDGEIAYMDSQIGRLLGWIESRRLTDKTLVIVVADHGESLGEKGEHTHGALIYEGTQRIPLLFTAPTVIEQGLLIDALVQQVDVFPTVMELFDWPLPAQASGQSLAPLLRGEPWTERPIYLESEYSALNFGWSSLHALLSGPWKYIQAPTPELYDLSNDPGETRNLAEERPDIVEALALELQELRSSMNSFNAESPGSMTNGALDLSALGYAQSSATANENTRNQNPIERIEVLELYHEAIGFGYRGETEKMIAPLERVVEVCPGGAGFRTLLGDSYRRLNRFVEARKQLELAIGLDPDYDPAFFYFAALEEAEQQIEPALASYRRVIALRPEYVPARQAIARLLAAQEDYEGALAQYEQIALLDPNEPAHWAVRANIEQRLGRSDRRMEALRQAALLAPDQVLVQNDYAWALATSADATVRDGKRAKQIALELVERTGRQDPNVLDTYAAALAELGLFEEALSVTNEALALARKLGNPVLVELIEAHLARIASEQPVRDL